MTMPEARDPRLHERSLELAAIAVDFELTRAETAELEGHLATCPTCSRRASAMRGDAVALGRPLLLQPSARVDAAIHAEIAGRRAHSPRLVLVVATVLLCLALLGAAAIGAYVLRTPQLLPITVVPLPTEPVALDSPRPVASPPGVGETWAAIDLPKASDGGLIEAVAIAGFGVVGVGRGGCVPDFDAPTDCYGAAWTATGREPWVPVPNQQGLAVGLESPLSGPGRGIFDVAAGPTGVVAIGNPYDGADPGVWRSGDGRTWQRLPLDVGGVGTFLDAVAGSPQGYVIVGRTVDYGSLSARAAAWFSRDGVTWMRAADLAGMDAGTCSDTGEEPDCGGMRAVAAIGSGFVAVGRTDAGDRSRPAAWTSPDGLTWTRSDTGLDFDGHLSGVTAGGPGVVAVGTICQPTCIDVADGVAASSLDGSAWTVARVVGSTELGDVVSVGGQTFAVGAPTQVIDPPAELQLWRTLDGVAWQQVPGLPSIADAVSFGAADIAATDGRVVVVGWASVRAEEGRRNFAFTSPTASGETP